MSLPPLQPNGNEFAETVPGPIWKRPPVDDEERRQRRRAELWIIIVVRPALLDLYDYLDEGLPILAGDPAGPAKVKDMIARLTDQVEPSPWPKFKARQVGPNRFELSLEEPKS